MKFLQQLELEHKILFVAILLSISFVWPVQNFFINRMSATLGQSIDPGLEPLLRTSLLTSSPHDSIAYIHRIERALQWKALIPIIVNELRSALIIFSVLAFVILFLVAYYALRSLTRPIKNLASAVTRIGKGDSALLTKTSGGSLGILERTVIDLESELILLREKTRIAGMESAWQDIASIMAHEIKNPLTPMRLTLDRLEEKALHGVGLSADEVSKYAQRINTQIDALERLVNQFRSFSKEPEAHCVSFDASARIAHALQSLSEALVMTTTGAGTAFADPYLLDQIVLNIGKNALEAGATHLHIKCTMNNSHITITCSDNGIGIAHYDLDRVWLPYVSLKKGGTGLGLPVVRKLVETMNGTISLVSSINKEDHGTQVLFTLPSTLASKDQHP